MTGYPDLHLYINGAWHQTGQTLPVLNPADETVIGALPSRDGICWTWPLMPPPMA